jgi:hypothetical protein
VFAVNVPQHGFGLTGGQCTISSLDLLLDPYRLLRGSVKVARALLSHILLFGLTDPAFGEAEIDSFISREDRVQLQAAFNDQSDSALVDDKARFCRHCADRGLSIPKTYGVLRGDPAKVSRVADAHSPSLPLEDLPEGR